MVTRTPTSGPTEPTAGSTVRSPAVELASLCVEVRRMGDVLAAQTKVLDNIIALVNDTEGDDQLIEVLKRLEAAVAAQTKILSGMTSPIAAGTGRPPAN